MRGGGEIVDAVERAEVRVGGVELHRREPIDLVNADVQHVDAVAQRRRRRARRRASSTIAARPVDRGHAVAVLREMLGVARRAAPEIDHVRPARHKGVCTACRARARMWHSVAVRGVRLVVAGGDAVERPLRIEQHH